jgi:uroporphyrinogen-III synthase
MDIDGVIQVPVLRIVYRDISGVRKIQDALVLTSKRGVIALKMSKINLGEELAYCIGKQTADYLERLYSRKCNVPGRQDTYGLAELLIRSEKSVHIVGSDQLSEKFIRQLREAGVGVKITVAYEIRENEEVDFSPLKEVKRVLFGSSKSFRISLERSMKLLKGKELYAIGRPTGETMKEMGYEPTGTFDDPDIVKILRELSAKR